MKFKKLFRKGGFTLVEIVLVIFLIALLGTTAVSSYINSTGIFNFLNKYQEVVAVMRTARSYALNNKQVVNPDDSGEKMILPDRFGVKVEKQQVTLFADTGKTPSFYDLKSGSDKQYDVVIDSKDVKLGGTDYVLSAADSKESALTLPVVFFYKTGTGELEIFQNGADVIKNVVVKKSEHKCVSMLFKEADKRSKYIVVFQVSGLAEEYDKLAVCKK